MPYTIMLDAGHGGRDPGAVYNGRQEKDDTLALALAVGEILQERGIDVLYTRTTDVYESPYQKAMEANAAGADFFISIHRNSSPEANTYSGVESLVYNKSGIKLEMAENINEQLEAAGFVNLGVKERPGLVVLRRTRMPAVLVEVGFINSDTDNMLFDNNFDDMALAIAEGILDTLQLTGEVPSAPGSYTVQTGAFRSGMYADRLQQELLEQDFPRCRQPGERTVQSNCGDISHPRRSRGCGEKTQTRRVSDCDHKWIKFRIFRSVSELKINRKAEEYRKVDSRIRGQRKG